MSDFIATMAESYPMKGGDGDYSYTKNSSFQRLATSVADENVKESIAQELDLKSLLSSSSTFLLADLGCSVGPNTFLSMQNIIEAIQDKYQQQGFTSGEIEFQVFFNDNPFNDFNTLFTSLPPCRKFFAAGLPGSFHGRLFPKSSLHFIHSSYALQWLSKVPDEVVDKDSPAWNKGRIHYTSAPEEVGQAYAGQFTKDMEIFLDARAKELVNGGMMVIIMPGIGNGISHSSVPSGVMFDVLGLSLMDLAKEGLVNEAQVDSFNLPVYAASPDQMRELVERNGSFNIVKVEITCPGSALHTAVTWQALKMHKRAGFEAILSKHFGNDVMDKLFDRFGDRLEEFWPQIRSSLKEGTQLFVVLKRK